MRAEATPSQTIGPFFAVLRPLGSADLVAAGHPGAVTIRGVLYDGAGTPVSDGLIEAWQANAAGRYAHPDDTRELPLTPGFTGYGRCPTSDAGVFAFRTEKPCRVPYTDDRLQAPHINLTIFARGLLRHLWTRIYFEDEAEANAVDPVLNSISSTAIRDTLIARRAGPGEYVFDIHLQGEKETAFFAI